MGKCKMCGICCKTIYLGVSPERVEDMAKYTDSSMTHTDAKFIRENWIPLSRAQALEINPRLVLEIDQKAQGKFYYYSCTKLDPLTNLCTVRDSRPPVCSNYPWYDRDPVGENIWYSLDCGYVNDHEEWVKGQTSEVEAPVEDLKYIKEGVIE